MVLPAAPSRIARSIWLPTLVIRRRLLLTTINTTDTTKTITGSYNGPVTTDSDNTKIVTINNTAAPASTPTPAPAHKSGSNSDNGLDIGLAAAGGLIAGIAATSFWDHSQTQTMFTVASACCIASACSSDAAAWGLFLTRLGRIGSTWGCIPGAATGGTIMKNRLHNQYNNQFQKKIRIASTRARDRSVLRLLRLRPRLRVDNPPFRNFLKVERAG